MVSANPVRPPTATTKAEATKLNGLDRDCGCVSSALPPARAVNTRAGLLWC
jgi:hypothetical protein